MKQIERRSSWGAPVLAEDGKKIQGYAAVFGPLSQDLGGFVERVDPQAFKRSLEDQADIRALLDHDSSKILGRTSSGTLRVSTDSHGLRIEVDLPDTSYARDLKAVMARGDVSQMSFGFMVRAGGESWSQTEDGQRLRTLTDVELIEVSIVSIPAYASTEAVLRSQPEGVHMKELQALREERTQLQAKVDNLSKLASKRQLTPEEQSAWDALTAQVQDLESRVVAIEEAHAQMVEEEVPAEAPAAVEANSRLADHSKTLDKILGKLTAMEYDKNGNSSRRSRPLVPGSAPAYVRDYQDRQQTRDRDLAMRGWALQPLGLVSNEQYAAADRLGFNLNAKTLNLRLWSNGEMRAQSTSTTAGGYIVPTGFQSAIEKSLLYVANLRQYATVLRTESGNPLQIPTVDDTAQVGERVSENSAMNTQDVTFGQKTLNCYLYNSKIVQVSLQLMQDSAIDPGQLFGELLGERLGRIQQTEFTTSDGSSKPEGVAYAAAAGVTAASATAIATDDLLGLVHSVDRAYRGPNAAFMMHDSILLAIRKLKDTTNQPIFSQSYVQGEPDRILGIPVIINSAMDSTMASTKRSVLFGDFSKFFIRDCMDLQIVRLDERYAEYGQVAFVGLLRSDSKLINTAAVKRLTH